MTDSPIIAAARREMEQAGWRAIESAPRDRAVMLYLATIGDPIVFARWDDDHEMPDGGAWYETGGDGGFPIDVDATHWQPFPNVPTTPDTPSAVTRLIAHAEALEAALRDIEDASTDMRLVSRRQTMADIAARALLENANG